MTAISVTAIEEFLKGFGWQPEPPKVEHVDADGVVHEGDDDSPFLGTKR